VQQHDEPAFFSPRTGVTNVIVTRRVDSVPFTKVVHILFCYEECLVYFIL
jgi:hypothetical protein